MIQKKQQTKETLVNAIIARRDRYFKIKADPTLYAIEKKRKTTIRDTHK